MRGLCQGRAEGKTAGKKRVVVEGRPDVFEGVGEGLEHVCTHSYVYVSTNIGTIFSHKCINANTCTYQ